ncbi:MAG: hypothetical protein GY906_37650 [bacterium]|nr:hypothetical protein [bacterium]
MSRQVRRALAGSALLGYAILLWLLAPATPFEWDEILFLNSLERYDIAAHSPHPPGYPAFVAIGAVTNCLIRDPFIALQLVSIVSATLLVLSAGFLAAKWSRSSRVGWLTALLTATTPAVLTFANVGLSDMCGAVLVLLSLGCIATALGGGNDPKAVVIAAVLTALAISTRPQLGIMLVLPIAWLAFSCIRNSQWPMLLWAGFSGLTCLTVVWLPAIVLTGGEQFLLAIQNHTAWMAVNEASLRLPHAPLSHLLKQWLVYPWGWLVPAAVIWMLAVKGTVEWWACHRRTALLILLSVVPFLLVVPWTHSLSNSVRYSVPVAALVAFLAAGAAMARSHHVRHVLSGLMCVLAVLMLAWGYPTWIQRATEEAPIWAALKWVRANQDTSQSIVIYRHELTPHAQYVLGSKGFRIQVGDTQSLNGALSEGQVYVTPDPRESLENAHRVFTRSWSNKRSMRLCRRVFLECAVWIREEKPDSRLNDSER